MKKNHINLIEIFKLKNEWLLKIILGAYILAYVGATYNHVNDIIKLGFFSYQKVNQNVSFLLSFYWTLLTFFDPLAIILLFVNTYYGLILYGIIIVSDVTINYHFVITRYGIEYICNFGQISQLIFMLFYLITVFYLYRKIKLAMKTST
jgi:hypothetical protein